jgi:uncharacterized membrane protein YgaE (UPF0421/DUF939 family)
LKITVFTEGKTAMSQRDGFSSGFFIGTFVGGMVGSILGAVLMSRRDAQLLEEEHNQLSQSENSLNQGVAKKRQMKSVPNEDLEMESARRSLEDKIAQLNETIDEVRNQLGNVNHNSAPEVKENYLSQD